MSRIAYGVARLRTNMEVIKVNQTLETRGTFRPAMTLFFLAPMVGEFLLGNLPVTWLWVLIVLAPLYGGGALLIREAARRFRLGWPGILLLGLAYAVVEEAFVTQSLFNPNYVGLRLLDYGYIPALGIGFWWTVFVLTIHTVWSIATPIALAEALSGKHRRTPWLGRAGLGLAVALFVFGCVAAALAQQGHFRASGLQLTISGLVAALLVALAFAIGRMSRGGMTGTEAILSVPKPIAAGFAALCLGSAFMFLAVIHSRVPAAVNVVGQLSLIAVGCFLLVRRSRSSAWCARHELAVAGGFLFTYAWYGFVQVPSVGNISPALDTAGNAILTLGAVVLFRLAWNRLDPSPSPGPVESRSSCG